MTVKRRTAFGRLFYDLALTDLSEAYLARKHRKPVAKIRELRQRRSVKALRQEAGLRNGPQSRR